MGDAPTVEQIELSVSAMGGGAQIKLYKNDLILQINALFLPPLYRLHKHGVEWI